MKIILKDIGTRYIFLYQIVNCVKSQILFIELVQWLTMWQMS